MGDGSWRFWFVDFPSRVQDGSRVARRVHPVTGENRRLLTRPRRDLIDLSKSPKTMKFMEKSPISMSKSPITMKFMEKSPIRVLLKESVSKSCVWLFLWRLLALAFVIITPRSRTFGCRQLADLPRPYYCSLKHRLFQVVSFRLPQRDSHCVQSVAGKAAVQFRTTCRRI